MASQKSILEEQSNTTKKWCPELWVDIEFDIDPDKIYYGPSEAHQFIEEQDPEEGYIVRGGPVYHKVKNPECDAY